MSNCGTAPVEQHCALPGNGACRIVGPRRRRYSAHAIVPKREGGEMTNPFNNNVNANNNSNNNANNNLVLAN